jgi:hypothetical protein
MDLSASDEGHVSDAGRKIQASIAEFVLRGECKRAHCPAMKHILMHLGIKPLSNVYVR